MRSQAFGHTDVGRRRGNNEDAFHIDEELGLYVVCDGMGGHASGEVASRLAVEAVVSVIGERVPRAWPLEDGSWESQELQRAVGEAIRAANKAVFEAGAASMEHRGMGCTLTMVLRSGPKLVLGHVGDSRLYLLRDEQVHQLSADHTLVAELIRQGAMKAEDAAGHPFSHVLTQAIGKQPVVRPDILVTDALPGDRYLLCSDGLSDYLSEEAQVRALMIAAPFEEAAQRAIEFANEAGGKDNITALMIRMERRPEDEEILAHAEAKRAQLEAVAAAPIFDEEFMAHLARVLHVADLLAFAEGQTVIAEGEPCAALYIPVEGLLEIRDGQGNLREAGPGAILGETSLFRPRKSRATVKALRPSRVLILGADKMRAMIRRHPFFGIGVLERLGRHLSRRLDGQGATMATVPDELSP